MDEFLESLYLLILLLVIWSLSFVIGIMLSSDLIMVAFFWISSIVIIAVYSISYMGKGKDLKVLKKELVLLTPIWLFLIYQSYITIRHVQMTGTERWALIPFVLGLGFYVALLKQNIEKKEDNR